jgi:hypothetical protein
VPLWAGPSMFSSAPDLAEYLRFAYRSSFPGQHGAAPSLERAQKARQTGQSRSAALSPLSSEFRALAAPSLQRYSSPVESAETSVGDYRSRFRRAASSIGLNGLIT